MTDIIERPSRSTDIGEGTRAIGPYDPAATTPILRLPVTDPHAPITVPATIGVVDRPYWAGARVAEWPEVERTEGAVLYTSSVPVRPTWYEGRRRAKAPLWARLLVLLGTGLVGGVLGGGAVLVLAVTW